MIKPQKKSPAFQFYAAEFLSDENVAVMSNQEVGCYIKLICYCWREGSIPSDIKRISRLCGESTQIMSDLWPSLAPCFAVTQEDRSRLIHPRLERERQKQIEHSKERSESGAKGAKSRWQKTKSATMAQPQDSNGSTMAQQQKNNSSAIQEPIANQASAMQEPIAMHSSASPEKVGKTAGFSEKTDCAKTDLSSVNHKNSNNNSNNNELNEKTAIAKPLEINGSAMAKLVTEPMAKPIAEPMANDGFSSSSSSSSSIIKTKSLVDLPIDDIVEGDGFRLENSVPPSESRAKNVNSIFEHWKLAMQHPGARLDAKRTRVISARLDDGYTVPDLKLAIDGCKLSPFHMGQNDQSVVYDGIEVIFKSGGNVDKFIALASRPKPAGGGGSAASSLSLSERAALMDWGDDDGECGGVMSYA